MRSWAQIWYTERQPRLKRFEHNSLFGGTKIHVEVHTWPVNIRRGTVIFRAGTNGLDESCRQERGQHESDWVSGCSAHPDADVSVKTLTHFTPQRAGHSQRHRLPSWRWTPWRHRTACRSQRRPVSWALLLCTGKESKVFWFEHILH